MSQHHLSIEARFSPEAVERILRVVRHRGFYLDEMTVVSHKDNINIEMTVSSPRPVDLLSAQLVKLLDVVHVRIHRS